MKCHNRSVFSFPSPANGGLGDRFGQYVQLATLAILKCLTIVTKWNKIGGRSSEYTIDIHDYVRFPTHLLQFVDTVSSADLPVLNNAGVGYQEGFDHIPETSHRMLLPEISRHEYMKAFHIAASSFHFKRSNLLKPASPHR